MIKVILLIKRKLSIYKTRFKHIIFREKCLKLKGDGLELEKKERMGAGGGAMLKLIKLKFFFKCLLPTCRF